MHCTEYASDRSETQESTTASTTTCVDSASARRTSSSITDPHGSLRTRGSKRFPRVFRWCVAIAALAACSAFAETGIETDLVIPPPPPIDAKAYLLIDSTTGKVLAESRADERLAPASLTKLMTAYVVFEALSDGRLKLDEPVHVSEKAWRMRGSRMFIEVNTDVVVADLLRGLIIQSGNDASVALAEHLAGSEEAFVAYMNERAAAIGMTGTSFRNSMGLPARDHYSTARDLALLAKAIIDEYPEYYSLYSEREFTYNNIKQHNRNRLLWRDPSVDGLKTGYTAAAGYCLVSTAYRQGMRVIAIVLGAETSKGRASGSQALLEYGFEYYETHKLYSKGEPLSTARVLKGAADTTPLGLARDLYVTIPRGRYAGLSAVMEVKTRSLTAPVNEELEVGAVNVSLHGESLSVIPLVVLEAVPSGGPLTRLKHDLQLWLD